MIRCFKIVCWLDVKTQWVWLVAMTLANVFWQTHWAPHPSCSAIATRTLHKGPIYLFKGRRYGKIWMINLLKHIMMGSHQVTVNTVIPYSKNWIIFRRPVPKGYLLLEMFPLSQNHFATSGIIFIIDDLLSRDNISIKSSAKREYL